MTGLLNKTHHRDLRVPVNVLYLYRVYVLVSVIIGHLVTTGTSIVKTHTTELDNGLVNLPSIPRKEIGFQIAVTTVDTVSDRL